VKRYLLESRPLAAYLRGLVMAMAVVKPWIDAGEILPTRQ
jgi:hypothetical protein